MVTFGGMNIVESMPMFETSAFCIRAATENSSFVSRHGYTFVDCRFARSAGPLALRITMRIVINTICFPSITEVIVDGEAAAQSVTAGVADWPTRDPNVPWQWEPR